MFFLSLGKLSIFWWWLKVTSKEWFENQKPRQGKSHRLTDFLVAHCSTKVGIFVCSEKNRKAWEVTGMIDSLEVTESCKIDTHMHVWSVWIIQNNYTELCDFYINQITRRWRIFVNGLFPLIFILTQTERGSNGDIKITCLKVWSGSFNAFNWCD